MKIRIEDNSVRFRLRKSEVDQLAASGSLCARTVFAEGTFEYCLLSSPSDTDLRASFDEGRIAIRIPAAWIKQWPESPQVGFENTLTVKGGTSLHLLVEKDFVCLDRDPETQKDQFPNPKQGKI